MKYALYLSLLALLCMAYADELSDCKCWEGYEAKRTEKGVRCHSDVGLQGVVKCNVPERPRCVCTGAVSGILTDPSGTWCANYGKGRDLRKWNCENKEEWDKYLQAKLLVESE